MAYAPRQRLCTAVTAAKIAFASSLRVVRGALEFECQHVEQHLRIRIGIDVAEVELEQFLLEGFAVGQVAVVGKGDAERRIDIEGLRFEVGRRRSRRRIPAVPDPGVAHEVAHVARAEHVAHVPAALVHVKYRTFAGHDARRVLAAVLQQQQTVVQQLVDRRVRDRADDATHGSRLLFPRLAWVWARPACHSRGGPPKDAAATVSSSAPQRPTAAPTRHFATKPAAAGSSIPRRVLL